jgi:hypothetical protein
MSAGVITIIIRQDGVVMCNLIGDTDRETRALEALATAIEPALRELSRAVRTAITPRSEETDSLAA